MNAAIAHRYDNASSGLGERVAVVALVLAVHVAVVSVWLMKPEQASVAVSEMSVSVAIRQAEAVQAQAQMESAVQPLGSAETVAKPALIQRVQDMVGAPLQDATEPIQDESASDRSVMAPPAVAVAPVHETSPDYRASYLNNPRPAYPMVARRMGWEGRVVLNVEVLADGSCGAVNIFQSSGHEALDNAALRTVQGWRFVPASRAGHAVTQWFKVPIQFSLKGNEA